MALYPGTTCFYEAEVVDPPSKRKRDNDYLLVFDDEESETPHKAISPMFVLNLTAPCVTASSAYPGSTQPSVISLPGVSVGGSAPSPGPSPAALGNYGNVTPINPAVYASGNRQLNSNNLQFNPLVFGGGFPNYSVN